MYSKYALCKSCDLVARYINNDYLTPKSYALDMHNGHEKTITGNSGSVLTGQLHLLAS